MTSLWWLLQIAAAYTHNMHSGHYNVSDDMPSMISESAAAGDTGSVLQQWWC